MSRLNVAVIGCGFLGRNHARIYNDLGDVSLVDVADVNEEAVKRIGERYHVDQYMDPLEVFERKDIEAVSICTPTVTHTDIALASLEAGKHILVEKPMTNTTEEAESMIKAAEKNGMHLAVGFVERLRAKGPKPPWCTLIAS